MLRITIITIVVPILSACAVFPRYQPMETNCGENGVSIAYNSPLDAEFACRAIANAKEFVKQQGLDNDVAIKIQFVDRVDYTDVTDGFVHSLYGKYVAKTNVVLISSWNSDYIQNDGRKIFGTPITRALYQSIITHEVTHRLMENNSVGNLSSAAHEFWSYVSQLSTMDEATRAQILDLYPDRVFESHLEINAIHHALDPYGFGIKSYNYFLENGNGLMLSMLEGSFDVDNILQTAGMDFPTPVFESRPLCSPFAE